LNENGVPMAQKINKQLSILWISLDAANTAK
jgi:hypothetical protein